MVSANLKSVGFTAFRNSSNFYFVKSFRQKN